VRWRRKEKPLLDVDTALAGMKALFRDKRTGLEAAKDWGDVGRFNRLDRAIRESPVPITPEQLTQIYDLAIEVPSNGVSSIGIMSSIHQFAYLLHAIGYRSRDWSRHAEYVNPRDHELLAIRFELAVEFLKRNNILRPHESVQLLDVGYYRAGKASRQLRVGIILQTQYRFFVIGRNRRAARGCYIMYPDREEHAYYGTMDYIELEGDDRVESTRSIISWRRISVWKKNVEHCLTYPRYIFGPGHLRWRLAEGEQVQSGEFQVQLSLENFKNKSRLRERHHRLLKAIAGSIASVEPEGEMVEILPDMSMNIPLIIIRLVAAAGIIFVVLAYLLLEYVLP